jgi:GT2 family glycosyltransferase
MNSTLQLSIIIVSYNTHDLTLDTVDSVAKSISQSRLLKNQSEIIVVDNDSKDETVAHLKRKWRKQQQEFDLAFSALKIIESEENLGFGRANNLALEKARGKYLLFLNSDTVVVDDALEKMVRTFESHPIDERTANLASQKGRLDRLGILAASLLNADQTVQPQGGSFPSLISLGSTLFFLDDIPLIGRFLPSVQHTGRSQHYQKFDLSKRNSTQLHQQDWVGGTAMMVRAELLQETGSFDPNIFMYAEDMELCLRAKDHHWDVAVDPKAQIIHYGSASSSSTSAIVGEFKGYLYIWAKHKPDWQMPVLKLVLRLSAHVKRLLFATILRQPKRAEPYTILLRNVLR